MKDFEGDFSTDYQKNLEMLSDKIICAKVYRNKICGYITFANSSIPKANLGPALESASDGILITRLFFKAFTSLKIEFVVIELGLRAIFKSGLR